MPSKVHVHSDDISMFRAMLAAAQGKPACQHVCTSRYVLDVRNNGGGLFPAGVELARMLIDSGDIVLIADSQGVMDTYEATGTSIDSKAPVAVLVNKGTASASEVTLYSSGSYHANFDITMFRRVVCPACT